MPQRTVEPLAPGALPRLLAADDMPLGRDDALVRLLVVAVKGGPLAVSRRDALPQLARRLAAAVAHEEDQHLMALFVEGQPEPLLVGTTPDKAPHLIDNRLQPEQTNRTLKLGHRNAQVVGQLLVEGSDEPQQLCQAQLDKAADAAQREAFEQ